MIKKEEINLYIEDRQDVILSSDISIDTLDEIITFIINDIKQKYQTDLLTYRDQENQYYELDQIIEFKRPHTFITIPQRHDVKTLAKPIQREYRNVYIINGDKVQIEKYNVTKKIEVVEFKLATIKKLNEQYLETLKGIFDDVILPIKRNSLPKEISIISNQNSNSNEPESPTFGKQQQKESQESVSPSWILRKSVHDNSQKKNELRQISLQELSKHCTEYDAWIAINQKIYDVTGYINKHPGGKEQIMKGIGTDATELFMKHHPWVNAHYLLEHNQIGFLIKYQ